MQKMALAYWSFHYAKRIFETFFVHRCGYINHPFSMPLLMCLDCLKSCMPHACMCMC